MKRFALAVLLALPATLTACDLGGQLAQRLAIARVGFAFDKVELTGLDIPFVTPNAKAHLLVTLKATNPNPIAATLDKLAYNVFIEGSQVGVGTTPDTFSIPAGETKTLALPVDVPYEGVPSAVWSALQNRRIKLDLKGTSSISTPLGPLSYPVELGQSFSL